MGTGRNLNRCHVVVRGRVQGVGFRWYVRAAARELGLRGRVSNRPDGGVEVEAEGAEDAIAVLVDRLRTGPTGASVSGLDTLAAGSAELPDPFTIDR